jgi:hypothetical protein
LFKGIRTCTSTLDENIDTSAEEKIKELRNILKVLSKEDKIRAATKGNASTEAELQSNEVALYNAIQDAIADLKGINFR